MSRPTSSGRRVSGPQQGGITLAKDLHHDGRQGADQETGTTCNIAYNALIDDKLVAVAALQDKQQGLDIVVV